MTLIAAAKALWGRLTEAARSSPCQGDKAHYLERSEVFCMLPWTHMSIATDGRVLPCCIADRTPLGHLRSSTLKQLWNSEAMRQLRRNMLKGRRSSECARCYEAQDIGLKSKRQRENRLWSHHFVQVERTLADGGLEEFRMPYMELQFSNLCNFRCRTCGPVRSSSWYEDAARLGKWVPPSKVLVSTRDPEELWRQIEPLLLEVEEIYFTGGEPLLLEGHYRVLDFLLARRRFHVRLRYNTNLSVTVFRDRDVLRLWDRFDTVIVGASLDAQGRRGEYLRKGQIWEQVLKNRERMFQDCPRAQFKISATLSAMNALDIPEMHRQWLERGWIAPDGLNINLLLEPEFYRVQILPGRLKLEAARRYEEHVEKVLGPHGNSSRRTVGRYREAVSFMMARDRRDQLERFRERTLALDRIRGESFAELFPELAELMEPLSISALARSHHCL